MKTKVKISEVIDLKKRLNEINNIPFDEMELIDDNGNTIHVPIKIRDDYRFTGLNNADYIVTDFYRTGFDEE